MALFSFIILFFLLFVLYFGIKAKNRTATLSSAHKSTFIDDNLTYDKTLINKSPCLEETVNSVTYLTSNSIRETTIPATTVTNNDTTNTTTNTSNPNSNPTTTSN